MVRGSEQQDTGSESSICLYTLKHAVIRLSTTLLNKILLTSLAVASWGGMSLLHLGGGACSPREEIPRSVSCHSGHRLEVVYLAHHRNSRGKVKVYLLRILLLFERLT